MAVSHIQTRLQKGWKWRLADSNGDAEADSKPQLRDWSEVKQDVPSVIQSELWKKGVIEDYRLGDSERRIQWVGRADWEYSCTFHTPKNHGNEVDLVFEGLDTIAQVRLNGKEILRSDNQFVPHRVSIKNLMSSNGEENELFIVFQAVGKRAKELEEKFGKRKSIMRDPIRCQFRKSAYHWGWDWGPIVLTAGPWKPVFLETYHTRIDDVHVVADLAEDHQNANVKVEVATMGATGPYEIEVEFADARGQTIVHQSSQITSSSSSISLDIKKPQLWWPNGQGEQHLYMVTVKLLDASKTTIDTKSLRFGIRSINVVQRPLKNAEGTTFMFSVNGREIFSQGACWIPADNLLPTISRERYFEWMKLAKFNHLNMIRVWGGGIYEPDDFFDACDEMGLLVWHDFAFACGDYPIHPEYLESIRQEANAQVRKWRNKTSLALICGNNEDFMLEDLMGVKYDTSDTTGPFLDKPFPQREIYLRVLPDVCNRLCPNIEYWPSSPWGGKTANDLKVGDVHQWNVWHAEQKSYQSYKDLSGRFMSEFGMHSFPVERTVNSNFFTKDTPSHLRHPQSTLIDTRNKGHGAETRLARYLAENFRYDNNDLSNWIYSTQLLQAEAYGYAYRDWKRKFGGPGLEECAGALVWQFNDCYPTTSWAFADYYVRPKPSSYVIRRCCANYSVGVSRTPASRWFNEDKPLASRAPSFGVFAHNMTAVDKECTLVMRAYDMDTNQWTTLDKDEKRTVKLNACYNTELCNMPAHDSWTDSSLILLEATLLNPNSNEILARFISWPEPYRYLQWPQDTKVAITTSKSTGEWENTVAVTANYPIKGLWLEPVYDGKETDEEKEPVWEDNMFDLMPETDVKVGVNGLRGRGVKARFLCDWELKGK